MVPGRLSVSRLGAVVLAGALLATAAPRARTIPTNDPGPFVPLLVAHAGRAYADALPRGATYRQTGGRLPAGVLVDTTGRVAGTPTETGVFEAVLEARQTNGV